MTAVSRLPSRLTTAQRAHHAPGRRCTPPRPHAESNERHPSATRTGHKDSSFSTSLRIGRTNYQLDGPTTERRGGEVATGTRWEMGLPTKHGGLLSPSPEQIVVGTRPGVRWPER